MPDVMLLNEALKIPSNFQLLDIFLVINRNMPTMDLTSLVYPPAYNMYSQSYKV